MTVNTRPAPLGLKVVARTLIYTTFPGGLAKGGGPVPDVAQETCSVVSLIPIHSRRVGTRPWGSCTRCTLRPESMSLDMTLRRCRDTSESSSKMKAAGPTHSGDNCTWCTLRPESNTLRGQSQRKTNHP